MEKSEFGLPLPCGCWNECQMTSHIVDAVAAAHGGKTYTFIDTGERRQPTGNEMYVYLPDGTIHNWEMSDGDSDRPEDYAILKLVENREVSA